jgi:hypothetical protein
MPYCQILQQPLEDNHCGVAINLENSTKQALNHACKLGWLVYHRYKKSQVTLCLTLKMRLPCDPCTPHCLTRINLVTSS